MGGGGSQCKNVRYIYVLTLGFPGIAASTVDDEKQQLSQSSSRASPAPFQPLPSQSSSCPWTKHACVHNTHSHACASKHRQIHKMNSHTNVCLHSNTNTCTPTHVHTRTCINMRTHMRRHTHTCTRTCTHALPRQHFPPGLVRKII